MASLDVRSALDVAKPSVVSRTLAYMGTHGHVAAALLEEMKDVRGSVCFENCETEFRYSRCTRRGSVEAPVLWGKVAKKHTVEKPKGSGRPRDGGIVFGGERDDKNRLSGMMWTTRGYSVMTRTI